MERTLRIVGSQGNVQSDVEIDHAKNSSMVKDKSDSDLDEQLQREEKMDCCAALIVAWQYGGRLESDADALAGDPTRSARRETGLARSGKCHSVSAHEAEAVCFYSMTVHYSCDLRVGKPAWRCRRRLSRDVPSTGYDAAWHTHTAQYPPLSAHSDSS